MPGYLISRLCNAGENIVIRLQARLPFKRPLFPKISPSKGYVNVYVSLPLKLQKKLVKLAQKAGKTESTVLRDILDSYLHRKGRKKLSYEPCYKVPPLGMKVLLRTVRKEQDKRLRELSEKTGRGVSELVREAVGGFC